MEELADELEEVVVAVEDRRKSGLNRALKSAIMVVGSRVLRRVGESSRPLRRPWNAEEVSSQRVIGASRGRSASLYFSLLLGAHARVRIGRRLTEASRKLEEGATGGELDVGRTVFVEEDQSLRMMGPLRVISQLHPIPNLLASHSPQK